MIERAESCNLAVGVFPLTIQAFHPKEGGYWWLGGRGEIGGVHGPGRDVASGLKISISIATEKLR